MDSVLERLLARPAGAFRTLVVDGVQRFRGWRDDGMFDQECLQIRLNQGLIDLAPGSVRAALASSKVGKRCLKNRYTMHCGAVDAALLPRFT